MACALTQGITVDCADSIGGLVEGYFIEFDNASFTVASNVVTDVTNDSGKRWWKLVFPRETAAASSTLQSNVQNGTRFWNQEVKFSINKMQTTVRNEMLLWAQNRLWFIGKDQNGKYWLFGRVNGLDMTAGQSGTGTASGDRNGYTDLTFTSAEKEMEIEVNSSVIADLETPGS